jgi:hypothetical protein
VREVPVLPLELHAVVAASATQVIVVPSRRALFMLFRRLPGCIRSNERGTLDVWRES